LGIESDGNAIGAQGWSGGTIVSWMNTQIECSFNNANINHCGVIVFSDEHGQSNTYEFIVGGARIFQACDANDNLEIKTTTTRVTLEGRLFEIPTGTISFDNPNLAASNYIWNGNNIEFDISGLNLLAPDEIFSITVHTDSGKSSVQFIVYVDRPIPIVASIRDSNTLGDLTNVTDTIRIDGANFGLSHPESSIDFPGIMPDEGTWSDDTITNNISRQPVGSGEYRIYSGASAYYSNWLPYTIIEGGGD
jgi:hypothetical protein